MNASQMTLMSPRDIGVSKAYPGAGMPLVAKTKSLAFGMVTLMVQVVFVGVLFNSKLDLETAAETDKSSIYNYYVGVALMMFVGFGYLMTFLKAYGLGAVGFTMLITCMGVEWAMILESYMGKGEFTIDFMSLLNANFAVAAVLISFGGLIGKVSPLQIVVVTLFELACYCANKVYFLKQYDSSPLIADCGGTIIIHVFGAYFGLAACRVLGPPDKDKLNAANYTSDLFSLIGTVFLWLFWPSFVAGGLPSGPGQTTALINTVFALLASTVVTFGLTQIMEGGKISTVPIQNATLAGGVSIGAAANLVDPFGACVVGGIAGLLSTWGFITSPMFGSVDTCGIHNLHGMPGLFGGLVSVVVPFLGLTTGFEGTVINAGSQMSGLVLTLVVSLLSGYGTGLVLKAVDDKVQPFNDAVYWETAEDITKAEDGNPGKLDA